MRNIVLMLGCVLALGLSAAADHPSGATLSDVRALQAELELLDESLADLDRDHPRAREFRDRADQIRIDLTRMRDDIRRHQQSNRAGLGASYSQVQSLRREIVALRQDVDDSTTTRRASRSGTIPDGTLIPVRLEQSVSSRTARREDRVDATVAQSVRVDGRIVIPAGTQVLGVVRDVERAERPARGGRLELMFDSVRFDDGTRMNIDARVVRLDEGMDKSETARRSGLGAILGGVVGGILEGKKGALVGILVGATGGLVASRGEDVELPAGTVLEVRLERPAIARR